MTPSNWTDTFEKVTDRLYISSKLTPGVIQMARSGYTSNISNVAEELDDQPLQLQGSFRLQKIGLQDTGNPIPTNLLEKILNEGLYILSHPLNKLLIHCHGGKNRSVSAAYLILRGFGLSKWESIMFLPDKTFPRYGNDVERYISTL